MTVSTTNPTFGTVTCDDIAVSGDPGTTFTQTYSTATATHSDLTSSTLTDSSAGTPATTITALSDGSTYANDVASLRNNLASLATEINALRVDLVNAKGVINSLVDALQAKGIVG